MSKVIGAIAAVVVLGAGGFAGATWYTGQQVDGKLDSVAAQLKGYELIKVSKRDFQKGFWTSTETVTYRFGCDAAAAEGKFLPAGAEITVRNVVRHNPFAAGIDTEFVYSAEAKAELDKVFKGKAPLSIHTTIPLSGDITTSFSSPEATYTEAGKGDFTWKGINGSVQYDRDLNKVKSKVTFAGFEIKDKDKGAMQFAAVDLESDQTRAAEGVYLGKQTMTWAGVNAKFTDSNGEPLDFSLGKSVLTSSSQLKDGLIEAGVNVAANDLVVKGKPVGALTVDYGFNRIDPAALKSYNDLTLKEGLLQCKFDHQADEAKLKSLVIALLKHDPAIKLAFKLKTPAGEGSYQIDLAGKGIQEADLAVPNPMALLPKLDAAVVVNLPRAVVEKLIDDFVPAEEAEMQKATFAAGLEQGVARGLIEPDEKVIKAKLALKGGKFEINGKEKTMEQLMMGE
ncbi:Uncharacterized conserved protein YdgA, DUF945 family [Andreprevotia lacus DSM 23236]|jgi:uncharacterized protein YdgA (DUF945 family)|uniref:Uncharacterized conserved protein YdgA, DUF945 family n=1 Tax=Andreprevotia lacus DSM 23236 TaxID=1121001 RepID=A0A1W1XVN6_9NEIS|nr:YdgA family protein [Andreprevotia lacus]SMC28050.1 Uncharacterized conserved protein YdgA, DUF945 family [Andreprevotia lacus DSM 23236]